MKFLALSQNLYVAVVFLVGIFTSVALFVLLERDARTGGQAAESSAEVQSATRPLPGAAPWVALATGLLTTLMLGLLLLMMVRRARQHENQVVQRTRELTELNQQLQREIEDRRQVERQLTEDKTFLEHLISGQDRDRQMMAYEIHDGVVQGMAASLMYLETILPHAPESQRPKLDQVVRLLRNSVAEARRVMQGLSPPLLSDVGLIGAIEGLAAEQGPDRCPITFHHQVAFDRLLPLLESTIFRIVQEAIANINRHSQASQGEIELVQTGDRLRLSIRDNGVGFEPDSRKPHRFGLKGMTERARLFDAKPKIDSRPGEGTIIEVEFPVLGPELAEKSAPGTLSPDTFPPASSEVSHETE